MLARILGTPVHARDGRYDFNIKEVPLDGSFTFAKSRKDISKKLGASWEETFVTQEPAQSISIMMTDRHLGRNEIATCTSDEGVRLFQIFDKLEAVAATVADQSMQSIRDFLLVQPAHYTLPRQQHSGTETRFPVMDRKSWVELRAAQVDMFAFGPSYRMQGPSNMPEDERRKEYKDGRWQHGVIPPSKMEISLILTKRGTQLGNLSEFDHA